MAIRSLKLLVGQSDVQKGTLLLLMNWHQKMGTCSQKGHFFHDYPGGGQLSPAPPPLGTALLNIGGHQSSSVEKAVKNNMVCVQQGWLLYVKYYYVVLGVVLLQYRIFTFFF